MESTWNLAKEILKERIPVHNYHIWIEPLVFNRFNDEGIVLSCPNSFYKKRIFDNYSNYIIEALSKTSGKPYKLYLEIDERVEVISKNTPIITSRQLNLSEIGIRVDSGRFLRKDFTFDKFVVGKNNDFAFSVAKSLASNTSLTGNSILLQSKTGLGKSHLSQAIGHHILTENPGNRIYYVTAEDFTNELFQSIQHDSVYQFKEKYRSNCDVLLLEDIHFFTGKDHTQIELALTLDYLFEQNKKIIFTSCYLPNELPKINDQLKSRFSSGIISKIDSPDYETRVKILMAKNKGFGYQIPRDILYYVGNELTDNVRQLESSLKAIAAKSSLLNMPITQNLAESVVKDLIGTKKIITIDSIIKLICKQYKLSHEEMISASRKKNIVKPRQIAIYLAKKYTDMPVQSIGKCFNRYHATAIHSINTIEKEMKQNSGFAKQIEYLCEMLNSGKC
ncbi:MAG: chromosomal replication initiator protein DnaA [Desulfobacterales bacterium]|nr:chromosomal replication initiator protein DnaA [Desulfobacterales bacterium]